MLNERKTDGYKTEQFHLPERTTFRDGSRVTTADEDAVTNG